MKKILFASLVALACTNAALSQTVIDLGKGGGLRSKDLNDLSKAQKENRQILIQKQIEDSIVYNDCLTRGFNALSRDSLHEAKTQFSKALMLRPNAKGNYVIQNDLGLIYQWEGQHAKAIELFTKVLHAKPERNDTRLLRASSLLASGRSQEAITDCSTLLSALAANDTTRKQVLFIRAAAYIDARLYANARQDLMALVKMAPKETAAHILLALADEKDGRKQEALQRLNMIAAICPNDVETLVARASLEEKIGMLDAARTDYDAAIKLTPSDSSLYLSRAKLLAKLGEKSLAVKDLSAARRLGAPETSIREIMKQGKLK